MRNRIAAIVSLAVLVCAAAATAAGTPVDVCKVSKNKAAGAYYACRQKAEATAILKAAAPDYSKCIAKFDDKWSDAETAGAGNCADDHPTPALMNAYLAAKATSAAAIVSGAADVPTCGDGVINAIGEHCEGADLDGHTCASFGVLGTLACTAGCDFDFTGCHE